MANPHRKALIGQTFLAFSPALGVANIFTITNVVGLRATAAPHTMQDEPNLSRKTTFDLVTGAETKGNSLIHPSSKLRLDDVTGCNKGPAFALLRDLARREAAGVSRHFNRVRDARMDSWAQNARTDLDAECQRARMQREGKRLRSVGLVAEAERAEQWPFFFDWRNRACFALVVLGKSAG